MSRESRRVRRQPTSATPLIKPSHLELPGPLRLLTNPKVFAISGVLMAAAIMVSLFRGGITSSNNSTSPGAAMQANELPDVPRDAQGTPVADASPVATIVAKTYTSAPPMTIDTSRNYLATITTPKGNIQIELYPQQAPEAVNAFVFLAQDGYYNGTPFMQLVTNPDGSRFAAQAGDPTRTGNGTAGFTIKKETTTLPFDTGAVGMASSTADLAGGQFFISFGDYPTLTGKYTIFGQVVGGLDVLNQLSLLNPSQGTSGGDQIQSVSISAE